MTKKLAMVFSTDLGKTVTISLEDPKEDLKKADVETVMNKIIEKTAFLSKNGKLSGIKEIYMRTVEETPVA